LRPLYQNDREKTHRTALILEAEIFVVLWVSPASKTTHNVSGGSSPPWARVGRIKKRGHIRSRIAKRITVIQ